MALFHSPLQLKFKQSAANLLKMCCCSPSPPNTVLKIKNLKVMVLYVVWRWEQGCICIWLAHKIKNPKSANFVSRRLSIIVLNTEEWCIIIKVDNVRNDLSSNYCSSGHLFWNRLEYSAGILVCAVFATCT